MPEATSPVTGAAVPAPSVLVVVDRSDRHLAPLAAVPDRSANHARDRSGNRSQKAEDFTISASLIYHNKLVVDKRRF
ncbi:MAG: hypothetical protein EOT05_02845 [Candidatus Microsaccharimonas sossegonensis]|uniref:Uncharacterized protein n=1 Tax=Candidatus Microsaccharimonas sossegonensis TaxID=2506948 RepID=A0A4Q0AHK7_9BACT|nr:MAG: hypothetical protein EOT05_02845 [Candidatus Microsaccharimonas sossegonensis]